MAATADVLAEVHVLGPAEKEIRVSPSGRRVSVTVQRCLRCDEIVTEAAPLYPVGTRVACAPGGGRMKRYVVDREKLRRGETICVPPPQVSPFVELAPVG